MTARTQVNVRKAEDRGRTRFGWLDSRHTFSFGDYDDPMHRQFRTLRVINEDLVAPGGGFPTHPHRDMEIFSYVLDGRLSHKDSMGNGRALEPGQIQLMSAGKGVTHSEFNPDPKKGAHFLQVWILPRERGLNPGYTEWKPSRETEKAPKVLVISPDGRESSAVIHQNADVYRLRMKPGETVTHELASGRGAWLQVMRGALTLEGANLVAGDGASAEGGGSLEIRAKSEGEALLFDLE